MKDLKARTIRGGFAKVCAQGVNVLLRVGSLMVLARMLEPRDFGLVGMVTAVTGVLGLLGNFGLSTAAVQRVTITERQNSTLFWINIVLGAVLGLLALAIGPLLAAFYHEPRLTRVTAVLALGFLFSAAGAQHATLLQREMRFVALSLIDIISLVGSIGVAIAMAAGGYGYWALVAMTITAQAISAAGVWLNAGWVPGRPQGDLELRSMMRFGGTVTLNGLVVYVAYNLEKVLLGRYWGADAIGIYGRAYQLVNVPTETLNSATGAVAFAALSRVQQDRKLLRTYFLKGYSLVVSLTIPITILSALLASDIIAVLLGPKWQDAVPVFRLLAPTILILAMINPFAWLLLSVGLAGRSLKIGLVLAPLVITGYLIGLSNGPRGVALGYSAALTLWVAPHIAWCLRGTGIAIRDVMQVLGRPVLSGIVAAVPTVALRFHDAQFLSPLPRIMLGGAVFVSAYLGALWFAMGQWGFYRGLVRDLRWHWSGDEEPLA